MPAVNSSPGDHRRLGATPDSDGTNFAVWAPTATAVWLCLFDEAGTETRIDVVDHTLGVWHIRVAGVGPGQRYGYRVDGPWKPSEGAVFNPDKLLLDPYTRGVDGAVTADPALSAVGPGGDPNPGDTAALTPRSVVIDETFDWGDDQRPDVPWRKTVIYETHVRGFSLLNPAVPEPLRGTYAGLGHRASIDYLLELGVTAVELLPVQQFASEQHLAALGLENYWGYNTIGFFAPHNRYSSGDTVGHQVREFKEMVKRLHEAGIEVILDVVYNHTAEAGVHGPALSLRGFDDERYYRHGDGGAYVDVTGCGNTVDASQPQTLTLILDSLRYWVNEMHVDGFRFDLAPALTRTSAGVDLAAPFLTAVHQDPVLRQVKLIAEPWDATGEGYLVGSFPPPWCEWNDKFRDSLRDFWRGHAEGVSDLATRFAGSADLYADDGRLPFASVNYVTAHDGFTLRDLVSYDTKHNEANGEDNRDGTDHNRSWNCGVEGETDDPRILDLRRRQAANLLASTLLATGVPMFVAGDERGRTQRGNNNAYCQDNPISWVDWSADEHWGALFDLTAKLLRLRADHPVLRQPQFFEGATSVEGGHKDITWLHPDGSELDGDGWRDPARQTLGVFLSGHDLRSPVTGQSRPDASYLLWLHAGPDETTVSLPERFASEYRLVLRTDDRETWRPTPADEWPSWPAATPTALTGRTVAVFEALP